MNVKKVGNVILAVRDLNKSVEFYNKILGMPIKRQRENWVDLGQSGALLSLHPADLRIDLHHHYWCYFSFYPYPLS